MNRKEQLIQLPVSFHCISKDQFKAPIFTGNTSKNFNFIQQGIYQLLNSLLILPRGVNRSFCAREQLIQNWSFKLVFYQTYNKINAFLLHNQKYDEFYS
ncbi:hypothetical protein FGO68_gene811 [Halteria grandinella]|uniref:Uncharacterized protein n=1 Tax=Halteria grandinella TaxID=5974 RepID=A0A8J8P0L6_HALGN|nr:hypothetical protein FGO68_gene811 [Halteria grandinella]